MSRSTGSIPSYIAKRRPQPEKPFRNELLNVERLQEHARVLGAELVDATPRVRAKPILQRLDDNDRRLLTVYRELATDLRSGQPITPAAEWLLDNYHLVAAETGAIRANLPKRYFDELPVSAGREVRIYVLARELLRHSDSRLDGHQLTQFLLAFQSVTPLTLGELWAWPSMLKLLLVENLRRLADQMSFVRAARLAADEYVTYVESGGSRPPAWSEPADTAFVVQLLHRIREEGPRLQLVQHHVNTYLAAHDLTSEDVVRQEHQQQAVDQVSVVNVVASLRVCASLDWGVFVESVSHVDQVLRRDPAGVYATMDFHSRDAQRRAVEDLAGQTGTDQVQVALRAVESARSAAAQAAASDRSAHVGYYLVGAGRPLLEADIAYTPRIGRRLRHALSNHPTFVYLGAISTLTGLLVALVVMGVSVAPSPWLLTVAALLTIAPASDIAIALVHRVVAHLVTPTRLPRLELKEGVPASARTMVIVPTLLTSVQQVESLLDQLEVIAIGNLEDNVHFAVLSDFADAPEGARDNDADVLTAAQDGIEALNRRYAPDAQDRFFLFHRERQWNARERTWMGWERKRGKIEEFNRLLRGATDTSYTVQIGALALLPSVRYCLTLDSDTRLPRDSARTLIGIASHPLHQPRVDATLGRVVEGYGVLQPRVSVTMASAAGSLFARTYAGYTGVDPYTTAVSDLYQDLFGEGIYTGKGLYDVDAFTAALEGRVPHNALLSHDLFEGLHVRTALATDVEVVDDYPTSLLAHSRRQHRWVRGDWQILWWLLPYVPTRDGIDRNRLPLISRWKILDNLRRSLFAPSLLALIAAGWTLLPGRPAYWTLVALAPLVWPTMLSVVEAGISTPRPWRAWLGRVLEALRIGAARSTLQLVFLAEDAAAMTHAIALTLTRILITKARLLEWETAADSAAKAETLDLPSFYWAMRASPAIAAALVAAVSIARPSAFVLAAPIAASWALAPLLGYWLSQPIVVQRSAIGAESLALMREIATRTWRFFETFVGEEDHHLPPDTVQLRPEQQVAHRTSPTNIGMYLLSTLAAHDLGLFGLADLEARVDATLTTVERLQRFEGHLLNWYDTRTLQPLRPAYVSTVDSGNLAGSLITLAEGLKELAAGRTGLSAERDRLVHLASRASALADGMNFKFLYDAPRHLFFIGFRLPDADGPGQHDLSHYDLLASEARLASFVAIAKGDVPQRHWFHLGRAVTSQAGQPVLVSWSATLFEYLLPLLVMRTYPETLLDSSCRLAVQAQIDYGTSHGVPWGCSESAYNVVDRSGNYQYKAFGVPQLGLKRGLADELVVTPYATALAASLQPHAAAANLRRLTRLGLGGDYGLFEAIDFTERDDGRPPPVTTGPGAPRGTVVREYLAHHQAMIVTGLANALLDDVMVSRFHQDPRVRATELLLQERVPREAPVARPRPADQRPAPAPVLTVPARRYRSPHTPVPHAQFLSNGRYIAVVSNAGGGGSVWQGRSVIRWRRDATTDPPGQAIYLRDVRSGVAWAAGFGPAGRREADDYLVTFLAERASFRRRDGHLTTQLDIAVSTEDDVEVRRLTIHNHGRRLREIDVTSYAEVSLAPAADDFAHPAFSNLFVETEYVADNTAILCRRRPRAPIETELWAVHVLSLETRPQGPVEWETDRARFLGRGRSLASAVALDGRALSGTTGVVLDPIASLRQRIRLAPGKAVRLSFSTGVAGDRHAALDIAQKYHDPQSASRTFALAYTHAQANVHHLGVSLEDARLFERLASRTLYSYRSLGPPPGPAANIPLNVEALWRIGISGDRPFILLRLGGENDGLPLVRQMLQAQEYWRLKGLSVDLVIVNEHPVSYLDELHGQLTELLQTGPWQPWVHKPGGAFLFRRDELSQDERAVLRVRARAQLDGDRGDLRLQVDHQVSWPVASAQPTRTSQSGTMAAPSRRSLDSEESRDSITGEPIPELMFPNGRGGFSQSGREFVVVLEPGDTTPVPWVNVIANPGFGTVVGASGSAFTWAGNSREHRLTSFANDPVTDPTSEALFVRDEDSGEVWSPLPGLLPRRSGERVIVRHAPGRTSFASMRGMIHQSLEVSVDPDDPVKISVLELTNRGPRHRRLSLLVYCEWCLIAPREGEHLFTVTDYDGSLGTVFATNAASRDFPQHVAFLCTTEPVQSATGDRASFIGRNQSLGTADGLRASRLPGLFGAGLDPCACLKVAVDLPPGQSHKVVVLLGQGANREEAVRLIDRHRSVSAAKAVAARVAAFWDETFDVLQVRTPDDSFDVMTNSWLLYQTLGCRVFARTGFFQPGGAFGFRDQLQDVLALCHARPAITRAHLLRAASRQFTEGDVQHWWHEPSGNGLRSRCSDDRLWLPFAVLHYVETTGDAAVLDERAPFLTARPLDAEAADSYSTPSNAGEDGSLYEHCLRAIDTSLTTGSHGLPLFGGGDWNDAMNLVGAKGSGESVWLGFFLHMILTKMAPLCEARGDPARATRYLDEAARLSTALQLAWDGEWYRRGYYDDGSPLGSAQNDECRIDSLAQSWAVLSDAVPRSFAERAMDAVRAHLVVRRAKCLLLLTPPFDRSTQEPGYIKGYAPGVRENGGQYTHAAVWVVMALAKLGFGDEAMELFHMLNPINHARTRAEADIYKGEPYVVAGDVYSHPQHPGRAGWTWYTGSAGWCYRLGVESLLGLRRHGATFEIAPCIPSSWPEFSITWRLGRTVYDIKVSNPDRRCSGASHATLDAEDVDPRAIPVVDDGRTHHVEVTLGAAATTSSPVPLPAPSDPVVPAPISS